MSETTALVLHVGLHKTGTSAIQHFFWSHFEDLEKAGVLYPMAGRPADSALAYGHHEIPWSLNKRWEHNPDAIAMLRNEIMQSDAKLAIVSSEEFDRLGRDHILRLSEELPFPTRVLFYYRRQSAILDGVYRTAVIREGEDRDIEMFARGYDGAMDFYAFAENWAAAFGEENIIARSYDPALFPGGDVVADFRSLLDIPDTPALEGDDRPYNKSPPWHTIEAFRQLRRLKMSDETMEILATALETVDLASPVDKGLVISPGNARQIDLAYADSNAAFHAKYCAGQPPITPNSGEGENAFAEAHDGLWPEVERTLLWLADYVARTQNPGGDA